VPFEIPCSWVWCNLEDICVFLSRGKSPKYSEDDRTYPVFAQKCNLKDGGISLEQARFLDPSTVSKWDDIYKLQTGDVLVNSTGTGTVGRTRLFDATCLGNYSFVVPDSHVSDIRTSSQINSKFIFAYISSKFIQQYLEDNLAGSTNQKELYIGVLSTLRVPIPSFTEQERIVAEIEKWFSLIDQIEQEKGDLQATIKQTRSKILDLAIHGKLVPQDPNDEPASELLKRINPKAEITCDNGQYRKMAFELPNTWVCCRLGDVISIKSGDSISVRNNRKGEYPIYGGNGISGYFCDYNVESDTIVIGRVGFYCGSVHKTKSKAWVTDNAFIVCYKNIFNSTYLKHLLEWLQLSKTSNSTAQPVISGKGIYPLLIPLPPIAEQQRIVDAIDKAFTKLNAIMESL